MASAICLVVRGIDDAEPARAPVDVIEMPHVHFFEGARHAARSSVALAPGFRLVRFDRDPPDLPTTGRAGAATPSSGGGRYQRIIPQCAMNVLLFYLFPRFPREMPVIACARFS